MSTSHLPQRGRPGRFARLGGYLRWCILEHLPRAVYATALLCGLTAVVSLWWSMSCAVRMGVEQKWEAEIEVLILGGGVTLHVDGDDPQYVDEAFEFSAPEFSDPASHARHVRQLDLAAGRDWWENINLSPAYAHDEWAGRFVFLPLWMPALFCLVIAFGLNRVFRVRIQHLDELASRPVDGAPDTAGPVSADVGSSGTDSPVEDRADDQSA